jgi:magnesium-transporting ATPase (P-type)
VFTAALLRLLLQESICKHGFFRNPVTAYGVSVSIAVMLLVVYAPFLQGIFSTWTLPGIGWVPQIGYAVFIFAYTEYSKKLTRADPDGWWATTMAW